MTLRTGRFLGLALAACLALAGCSTANPMGGPTAAPPTATDSTGVSVVRVGSANFGESEIVAELYAQALEARGVTVERTMQIGARDVYLAALRDGSIDLVPEYTGNLLQYFDAQTTAKTPDEVNTALADAAPDGMVVLTPAQAEDKDSYNVTAEFAQANGVSSLEDLAGVNGTLRVGGLPELAERPYGPKGLTELYGVPADRIEFVPISDGGGPLTVKALVDGDVQLANIFSTTPAIKENGFVTLEDPKNMIVPQNVVPLLSDRVAQAPVTDALEAVSAELTTDDLLAMNGRNSGAEKASPADIARDWLAEKGLAG